MKITGIIAEYNPFHNGHAYQIAKNLHKIVAGQIFTTAMESSISVTVSIGLTELRPNDNYEKIFQRADEALYKAKENGRNQIVIL